LHAQAGKAHDLNPKLSFSPAKARISQGNKTHLPGIWEAGDLLASGAGEVAAGVGAVDDAAGVTVPGTWSAAVAGRAG